MDQSIWINQDSNGSNWIRINLDQNQVKMKEVEDYEN